MSEATNRELPPATFSSFTASLAASAMSALGEGANDETNLPLARHTIDLLGLLRGALRAHGEQVAQQEAETASAVTDFLVGLFEVVDPESGQGSSITAREILDQGALRIDRELAEQR